MRILCTGSEGFVGKHLTKRLINEGHDVEGFDLVNGDNICVYGSVKLKCLTFRPNIIVHLAGQVYLTPSITHPVNDAKTNIIGTLNILHAANIYNAKVIYASSGAVYGSNDRSNIKETDCPEPISPYGLSKLTAERYVILYNKLFNMQNVVFRFSSIYGQGRKKTSINLIWDLAVKQKFYNQENPVFPIIKLTGDGNQTRDFTHVDDVVNALSMAVNGKFPPDIYNVGTGTSTSLNQLVKLMEQQLQCKLIVEHVEAGKGDPKRNDFNVDKANMYGFKAKTSLKQGLLMISDENEPA